MNRKRRNLLKTGSGVTLLSLLGGAGLLVPHAAQAQAWNKAAFDTHSLAETMKALGGGEPAQSQDIVLSDAGHRGKRCRGAGRHQQQHTQDRIDRNPD